MIFDTRTGRFMGSCGYNSVDTSPRGSVARLDVYVGLYIDFGSVELIDEEKKKH